jgi:hypothetical protein
MPAPIRLRVRQLLGRTATPTPRDSGQCQATTKAGRRCRLAAYADSPYCLIHQPAPQPPRAA